MFKYERSQLLINFKPDGKVKPKIFRQSLRERPEQEHRSRGRPAQQERHSQQFQSQHFEPAQPAQKTAAAECRW